MNRQSQLDPNASRTQIYEQRMQRFLNKIRAYQNDELKKIQQKSNDEIQFQTNKIISENRNYDNETFNKKNKSLEVQSKIKRSRKINESRLSKMKLRFEMIESVQNEIKNRLLQTASNQQQYAQLLQKLIIQGLIKLLEEKVEVKCLARDAQLVQSILPNCEKHFSEICDIKTQLILSRERLPQAEIGGIMLTSFNGKIVCSNTLKARLDYAIQQALPEVRRTLFTTQLQQSKLSSVPSTTHESAQPSLL